VLLKGASTCKLGAMPLLLRTVLGKLTSLEMSLKTEMDFMSFQSKFWGKMKDRTMVRMREMNRLKQPPVRAGPICCKVVVDSSPNSMWASTSHAATPIPCPTKAAADTHMSVRLRQTDPSAEGAYLYHLNSMSISITHTTACRKKVHIQQHELLPGHTYT